MKKGILGRKVGMTQVFTTDGKLMPVTVVAVENNVISQIKTVEKDGYNAVQISAFNKKEKASNRAEMGHFKKANTEPKRFLKEIRGIEVSNYQVGQVIGIDTFEAGEIVDVTGTSKGKGFAGVIKRHGVSRGPETHGSTYHRRAGSMGTMRPMRVLKGKKLAGHMGNEQVTIQNLEIIDIDLENNCILISGNIPGAKKSLVYIRTAVKGGNKNTPVELISYDEETEVIESEEVTPEETEVIENEEVSKEVNSEVTEEVKTETIEDDATNEEVMEEAPLEESKEAE